MRHVFQTLREVAVALVILFAVAALFTAVVWPGMFAQRMAVVFDSLEREGFDLTIKTPVAEASFDRAKAQQIQQADETILELRDRVARLRAENDALATELPDNARPSVPTVAPAPAPEPPETVDPPPAPEPEITAAPSEWVVIAGAERDLDSQRHELRRLQRGGFADALILKSGNWYQSSVIFPDRAAAEAGLREVSEIVGANRGAYIRAMDVYCPERTPVEGQPDVFACAG